MATAKRVKQEDKVETVPVPSTTQFYHVSVTNGVETNRTKVGSPVTSTFISQKRTPQPDRIVLEMSVEEAREVKAAVSPRVGHAAYEIFCAIGDALSPEAGTQTSPAKDAENQKLYDHNVDSATARGILTRYR